MSFMDSSEYRDNEYAKQLMLRVDAYLWNYYKLPKNDKEHMELLQHDIWLFERWLRAVVFT